MILELMIYWGPAEKMPLDLFSYIREAGICFSVAGFLATIVFSSTAVELELHRDGRTKDPQLAKDCQFAHFFLKVRVSRIKSLFILSNAAIKSLMEKFRTRSKT